MNANRDFCYMSNNNRVIAKSELYGKNFFNVFIEFLIK